jgi:tetratricopeptide (TPR) repeat protein
MRLVRYFPMVVVGAGFVCQAAMPLTARAWENPAYEVNDSAAQPSGRIVDPAIQQAGYYDSRPRQNATAISNDESSGHRTGPLFHGKEVQLPSMPFGRQKPNNRTANQQPQVSSNLQKPNYNNQSQVRGASRFAAGGNGMQPRVANGIQQNVANNNRQPMRGASAQPPIPIRQPQPPMPLASRPPMSMQEKAVAPIAATAPPSNTSPVSPWTNQQNPQTATARTVATAPTQSRPQSPSQADLLVKQAHQWSASAKSEQDYTRIIETCRRAQASQASPEAAKFAGNLSAWSLNRRGQLKAEAGQDQQALLDFDDAVRADANCWRAVHNRGVLLAQSGKFEKAFDDFSHTIKLNPNFAKAYSNRAALFMVANNLNAAEQDYKQAVALDPNLAVAHRGYGRVCQLQGHLDEAVGHYDAAVQLAPTDDYAAACRADLLTDLGRYADASAEYDRALAIAPKSRQANCGSAWLLATCPDNSLRNPQLALERAKSAMAAGGQKDAISYDSLAAAQASSGDFKSAMQSIHRAIELAPPDERETYRDRLNMYQQAKPYRIAPVERVAQASYASGTGEPGAGSKRF